MTTQRSQTLFRHPLPALHPYPYLLTRNPTDADDLVQDALIRLRGAWSRVNRQDDPTGYVRMTMARLHIRAGAARGGMIEAVERGHRVRRRRQAIGSVTAVLMVVALVAAGVTLNPFGGTAKPAPPATWVQEGPWRLPRPGVTPAAPGVVWPHAFTAFKVATPDGAYVTPIRTIDATHLLVAGTYPDPPEIDSTTAFYSYDQVHKTFATVVSRVGPRVRETVDQIALTPHWLIWAVENISAKRSETTWDVYKAPLTGGARQPIATLPAGSVVDGLPWFATDQAIYWSGSKPGVMMLPVAGGTPTPLAGFGSYTLTDDSPWAARISLPNGADPLVPPADIDQNVTHGLRNILTGATLAVNVAPHTAWLACSPTFCVGQDGDCTVSARLASCTTAGKAFIERLDGRDRTQLPAVVNASFTVFLEIHTIGTGGVITADRGDNSYVMVNPRSGRSAITAPESVAGSTTDLLSWTADNTTNYLAFTFAD